MEDRRKEKREIGRVQAQPDTSSTPSTKCHWRSSPRLSTRHEDVMRADFSSIYKYCVLKPEKSAGARSLSTLGLRTIVTTSVFLDRIDFFSLSERHNGVLSIVYFLGWQTTRINIVVIVSSVLLSNIVDMLLIRVKEKLYIPFATLVYRLDFDLRTYRVLWQIYFHIYITNLSIEDARIRMTDIPTCWSMLTTLECQNRFLWKK